MQYKLIRTDSLEQACKIELPNGKHLVGRGAFFNDNIDDKRVSRKHAELEVTDDSVSIKSLHSNPCFYIKKDSDNLEVIKLNDVKILHNGDKFGILPKSYWYELIKVSEDEPEDILNKQVNNEVDVNIDSQKTIIDSVEANEVTRCESNDSFRNDEADQSQSLLTQMPQVDQTTEDCNAKSPSISNEDTRPTVKRELVDEDPVDEAKKIKIEPIEPEVKQEPSNSVENSVQNAATPGPSNVNKSPLKDNDPPPSPAVQNPPRERCMYGASCYRRNVQHKAQFSHPGDGDWAQGAQGDCPFGAGCRRRNPRHWLHSRHPPGTQPPPPQAGQRKREVKKRAKTSESEEDEVTGGLILTGPRTRKRIQLTLDANSRSESECEDPYATDDSEEWQPSSDFIDTQDF